MKTIKIKKSHITLGVIVILIVWYISYGIKRCQEEKDVIKLEFHELNPLTYDFPFGMSTVINVILDFDNHYGYMEVIDKNKKSFRLALNGYFPQSYQYVYRNNFHEGINTYYDLLLRLDSLSPDSTRVIVQEISSRVQYGVKLWKDVTFDYYWYQFHNVEPSGIREYEFLRLLGKRLGYIDKMPYVKYPKELSQELILKKFGSDNLFTIEEMFENPEKGLKK